MAPEAEDHKLPQDVDAVVKLLLGANYVSDRSLATVVLLACGGRPLFLEGEAGVGKTEIAKVLSQALGRRLIRLQCYEGLDLASAVYEWNYPRQMVEIRLAEVAGQQDRSALAKDIFSERFLIERPLLQALRPDPAGPPVLLIDELDRADEPFEAFLLEVLSDFQITIPELGTIRAPDRSSSLPQPHARDHDALKRRCLCWVDIRMPSEMEIPGCALPGFRPWHEVVAFVQRLRERDLFKLPGIAETIDWAEALIQLNKVALDPATVDDTLGVLLKYQDDIAKIEGSEAARLLQEVKREVALAGGSTSDRG